MIFLSFQYVNNKCFIIFQILHCIERLSRLPVSVRHLEDTGIGRTVNGLRKFEGEIAVASKTLVAKWKTMVAEEESSESEEEQREEEDDDEEDDDEEEEDDDGEGSEAASEDQSDESNSSPNEVVKEKHDDKHISNCKYSQVIYKK